GVAPRETPSLEVLAVATYWSNYYYGLIAPQRFTPVFTLYWSLCVEEHFYLFWPLLLRLLPRKAARVVLAISVVVVVTAMRVVALQGLPVGIVHNLTHFRLDSILWGALAALVRLDGESLKV